MYLAAAFCAHLFRRHFPGADPMSRTLSFAPAMLLAFSINQLVYCSDFLLGGARLAGWPVRSPDPARDAFVGALITLAGLVVTCLTWGMSGGHRHRVDITPHVISDSGLRRNLKSLYLLALLAAQTPRLIPGAQWLLGPFLPAVTALGSAALFFLIRGAPWSRMRKVTVHFLLSAPFLAGAVASAGKEPVIVAMLPVALTAWFAFRSWTARASMVVVAVALLGLITNVSTYLRLQNWNAKRDATTTELIGELYDVSAAAGHLETSFLGLSTFLERANAASYRGYSVAIADNEGRHPSLVFGPLGFVFIPRLVWPEKPLVDPGKEYNLLVFGTDNSSLSAGFYTSFYLGAGWVGVLAAAIALGALVAGLLKAAAALGGTAFTGLLTFALLPSALRMDEGWGSASLAGLLITIAYSIAVWVAVRWAGRLGARTIGMRKARP